MMMIIIVISHIVINLLQVQNLMGMGQATKTVSTIPLKSTGITA